MSEKTIRSVARPAGLSVVRTADGAEAIDGEVTVQGLAVPWDSPTVLFGRVSEQFERGSIKPESYTRSLGAEYDAKLNVAHDQGRSIASVEAGSLEFFDSADGLRFEARLDTRDPDAQAAAVKIGRGDFGNASIEFAAGGKGFVEERTEDDDGNVLYSVKSVGAFFGVAVLAHGAYSDTEVGIDASRTLRRRQEREFEGRVERILDGVHRGVRHAKGLRMEREMMYDELAACGARVRRGLARRPG